jgi:putative oxidoreductase
MRENTKLGYVLLLIRCFVGVAFVVHGTPKIEHPLTWLDDAPFHPPAVLQAAAAGAEFFGGWAFLFGVGTRIAASLIAADMLVAIFAVNVPHGVPLVSQRGPSLELPVLYLIAMIAALAFGAGRYSLDELVVRLRQRIDRNARNTTFQPT